MATPGKKTAAQNAAARNTGKKSAAKKRTAASKRTRKKAVLKKAVTKTTAKRPPKRKSTAAGSRTAPLRAGLPNIDYGLCKGCGGCADAFPRLFEMRGDLAWVINAESFDPQRDSGVMTVCPYYAISLE